MISNDPEVLTVADLFCGCGGMTRGFVDAGFQPTFALDNDVASAATYAVNFPTATVIARDIATIMDSEVPRVRVVVGGPPCQGFSGLGKRDPTDSRNGLWKEYKRLVHLLDPDVFVIENVARFLKAPEFVDLKTEFETGGLSSYEYVAGVLRAEDYGVPQRRHRAFVIASRVGTPALPKPTHGRGAPLGGALEPWKTVRDAFAGLAADPESSGLPERTHQFGDAAVPGPYTEAEIHVGRTYRPDSIRRYDAVPEGGNRFNLPPDLQFPCWRDKPSGTTDVLGRLTWAMPSLTIRTEFFKPEKGRFLHPRYEPEDGRSRANRAITHAEAARLQSFDTRQLWCGSKVAIARQIGNAVPPILSEAIASEVRRLLSHGTVVSEHPRSQQLSVAENRVVQVAAFAIKPV